MASSEILELHAILPALQAVRRFSKAWVRKWKDQKGLCCWCLRPMLKSEATIEHICPLSQGGAPKKRSNLALSHGRCNSERGSLCGNDLWNWATEKRGSEPRHWPKIKPSLASLVGKSTKWRKSRCTGS